MSSEKSLRDLFIKDHVLVTIATCYPIKTLIRFQQKFGTTMFDSIKLLQKEGGIRRFYSGIFYRYIGKSGELICMLDIMDSINSQVEKSNPFSFLYQFTIGKLIQFTFIPFNSLYYFQQIYGHKEGRNILQYKVKQNGVSGLYHGFTFFILSQLIGGFLSLPALYNYNNYIKEENLDWMSHFYLYSTFLTYDVIANPLKILAIQKLITIQPQSYSDILAKLVEEQKGYQWIFRSIDTKLCYSFLKTAFMIYIYDYKKCKIDQ